MTEGGNVEGEDRKQGVRVDRLVDCVVWVGMEGEGEGEGRLRDYRDVMCRHAAEISTRSG